MPKLIPVVILHTLHVLQNIFIVSLLADSQKSL
jgi:hypothetical protein